MRLWEIIIVAIGLALDAFTVAVCRGATQATLKKSTSIFVGMIFGAIQTLMLAFGMLIAIFPMLKSENLRIISLNQWFSAIILIYLGLKFFRNAFKQNNIYERREAFLGYKAITILAFATSLDALILGISLGLLQTKILINILILFIVTSILVALGLWMGYRIGDRYKKQIDICGGVILLVIGIKVILNYFNII